MSIPKMMAEYRLVKDKNCYHGHIRGYWIAMQERDDLLLVSIAVKPMGKGDSIEKYLQKLRSAGDLLSYYHRYGSVLLVFDIRNRSEAFVALVLDAYAGFLEGLGLASCCGDCGESTAIVFAEDDNAVYGLCPPCFDKRLAVSREKASTDWMTAKKGLLLGALALIVMDGAHWLWGGMVFTAILFGVFTPVAVMLAETSAGDRLRRLLFPTALGLFANAALVELSLFLFGPSPWEPRRFGSLGDAARALAESPSRFGELWSLLAIALGCTLAGYAMMRKGLGKRFKKVFLRRLADS